MKKILIICMLFLTSNTTNALDLIQPDSGLITTCTNPGTSCAYHNNIASTCTSDACNNCKTSTSSPNTNNIVTITEKDWIVNCPTNSSGTVSCTCNTRTKYSCANGYYGIPTSTSSTTCDKCPAIGSECKVGENQTLKCISGYFKANDSCYRCPSDKESYITCSDETLTCAKGYYKSNNTCFQCPTPGTNANSGALNIGTCFIAEGTTFTTTKGNGKYIDDCPY